jgi:hypothetical protein
MDRLFLRYLLVAVVLVTAAVVTTLSGCQAGLTALYLLKGTNVEPDYAGLKGKKVAVVCRPVVGLQYSNPNASRDLAAQVSKLLKDQVSKIKIVDSQKVSKWCDENTWEEYAEVGKAVKADVVVGIELERLDLYLSQTLYQGKANATVRVYDCKDGGKLVFEKMMPLCQYPPNYSIPTSEVQEPEFRREFIGVLAERIGRNFYAHDPNADMAQDAMALH